jgi:U3 small nucleolar ribonucleoprotein component
MVLTRTDCQFLALLFVWAAATHGEDVTLKEFGGILKDNLVKEEVDKVLAVAVHSVKRKEQWIEAEIRRLEKLSARAKRWRAKTVALGWFEK